MKRIFFVLPFALIATKELYAASWLPVFSSDTDRYYINIESVKKTSYGMVNAWFKKEIVKDTVKDGQTIGDYTLLMYQVDCEQRKYGVLSAQAYKNNKHMPNSSFTSSYSEMTPAVPESIGEGVVDKSCKAWEMLSVKY
ncbi:MULTISPECIES: surface-adhesin E family protein [unclassified Acinetobacter]|uniref:surface-adhesin E family protein n=1 Tax=unclassified Acinetobacter TaxID=196816 RepID=UPI002D1E580D|nr:MULTISPECIES: surface-adhesin E family protein [unclassified Acinetobacter]MEB3793850.1 hypothetical protein [Acinetobacter sp. IK24]MEB3812780.1 hypothetical protein [Acinetobacter sp. IK22]MEB3832247.1 hypothetical protein [Acinetobacter sp. IK23]MEB3837400.1 hypothetical protein [Acinetobacter sp. IK25]